ncbi:hypothetical protein M1C57_14235 [Rhodococcus pyridinivorans]|uniref:hypothetical protein n=1 Tax=Rhodococcus pyridinivorans TaxID=103816 RepID=UPI00200ABFEC|nr:hypothetical protein [Rhodococcus pyridinivorans]UPW02862.1 hypothetical protein M1C57_14235 [Rhodococcus pyridinivorans]
MSSETAPTIAEIVGRNAQRLRGERKIEEIALAARTVGLKWNSGRVYELENGRVSPTLPTLLALCMALSDATKKPVSLVDLVYYSGPVQVNDRVMLDGSVLADALRGEPADFRSDSLSDMWHAMAVKQAGGETEQRAAQSLGISGGRFKALALELWGRPFAEERDARAGEGANAQKRGRVARQLKDEMRIALEGRRNGDD